MSGFLLSTLAVCVTAGFAFAQSGNLSMIGQTSVGGHVSRPQSSFGNDVFFLRGGSPSSGPYNAIMQGAFGTPGTVFYEAGDEIPNRSGYVFADFLRHHVTTSGSVWFHATYHPIGQPELAVAGWFLNGFWVADVGSLSLASSGGAIWAGEGGILTACGDDSDPSCFSIFDTFTMVPNTSPPQRFDGTVASGINDVGVFVFATYGILVSPPVEDSGLFYVDGDNPFYHRLVRKGDLPPGASLRPAVGDFSAAVIDQYGNIAFGLKLDNGTVAPIPGVWIKRPLHSIELICMLKDTTSGVPGTTLPGLSGGELEFYLSNPVLAGAGDVVFSGMVGNGSESLYGIWKWVASTGLIEKVLVEGDDAPGTCSQFAGPPSFVWTNEIGDVAFYGATSGGELGVWIKPEGDAIALVAKIGDWVTDLGGTRRKIAAFNTDQFGFSSPGNGNQRYFDGNGRVVMRITYSCDSESGVAVVVGEAGTTDFCECDCSADFNGDGDLGTDADIEAFFACLAGNCCCTCDDADFNFDGDTGTDADIEAFFRVLAGNPCNP